MGKARTLLASVLLTSALVATAAAQGGAVKDIPATSTISDSLSEYRAMVKARTPTHHPCARWSRLMAIGSWTSEDRKELRRHGPYSSIFVIQLSQELSDHQVRQLSMRMRGLSLRATDRAMTSTC